MDSLSTVFTKNFINKLESLNLAHNKNILNSDIGNRKSKLKGYSSDFSDFRNYNVGDDLKRVDWNSYARFDKLYVKLFDAEKQAKYAVLIDCSKSMDFGDKNKLFYAKTLAASLAYIALKNSDSIDILAFNDSLNIVKRNSSSKVAFNNIVKSLDSVASSGFSNLTSSLESAFVSSFKNKTIFIVSDFLYENNYEQSLKKLSQYNKIVLVQTLSLEELNPEIDGNFKIYDSESRLKLDALIDSNLIKEYKENLKTLQNSLLDISAKINASYICPYTHKNILDFLYDLRNTN